MSQATAPEKVVLVVDDSELAREIVKDTLESAGFRVIALESAFGFVKAVREHQPGVILLDVGLASMNGTKLVSFARQHARTARILLYSGRSESELAEDVRESGADGFISKRTTDVAFITMVSQHAQRRTAGH